MHRYRKSTMKTTVLFSTVVFAIMSAAFIVIGGLVLILHHYGFIDTRNPPMIIAIFGIISVATGTVISAIVGKRLLTPIINISEATKKVAKGDFKIVMEENSLSSEVRLMVHNFNLMARELDSTEIFRNDFVNNVSHEFKTPLSTIEGYATLLQTQSLSEEKRRLYASKIISNTRRLATLTGNVLQLSRLENCTQKIKKETFSLDEQIREIAILFEKEWEKKNIDLELDLQKVDYYGSSELLSQVWQNLLGNAIKFTSKGGSVSIKLESSKTYVTVSVADTGVGMSEETCKRIFEKFYQGDTSHGTEGNGLGMTLVKNIIDLHGGNISVDSKLSEGTVFNITLPVKDNNAKE